MTAAQSLTVALVTRHFQSRVGGWDPAMLDIAQDHALCHLDEQRLFSMGLVFKGGTALRKCRSGPAGRGLSIPAIINRLILIMAAPAR